jgi:hypothetical protein
MHLNHARRNPLRVAANVEMVVLWHPKVVDGRLGRRMARGSLDVLEVNLGIFADGAEPR